MTDALPQTLYRSSVVACDDPANAHTLDFMSDYLSMMDVLAKAISHGLDSTCGITPLQYRILVHLLSGDAGATLLSRQLDVGLSTVSAAIAKLADAGCVLRREEADDMRAINLRISPKGRALLGRADDALAEAMADHWRTLTREQLAAALTSSREAVMRHSHLRVEEGRQRLDTALVDTVMISRALTARALRSEGMTTNDFRILLALRSLENSTAGGVADFLFLNSSDLTSCLKHLESHGLITRERAPADRRTRMLRLTERGRRRLIELMPVVFDALHETCHSDDELIRIHISAAADFVERRRARSETF